MKTEGAGHKRLQKALLRHHRAMEAVVASASYDELRAAVVSQDRDRFWELVHRDERLGRALEEAANEVWEASDPFTLAMDHFREPRQGS